MALAYNGSGGTTKNTYTKNGKTATATSSYNKLMKSNGWTRTNTSTNKGSSANTGSGNSTNKTYSNSSSSSSSSTVDNSAEIAAQEAAQKAAAQAAALKAAMQARTDAVNAANSALDQQGQALEQKYNTQLSDSANDYQTLRNQNDVNYMKALYNQREALANRGALNSGTGRYENLVTGNTYNKTLNNINSQEASERQNIKDNISSMWASIAQQKASNNNTTLDNYTSALQNIINSTYSGYSPTNSDYYNNALSTLNNAFSTTSNSANNGTSQNGVSAYARLLASLGYDI